MNVRVFVDTKPLKLAENLVNWKAIPEGPVSTLTEQAVNTSAVMIRNDPQRTVLCGIAWISAGSLHTLLVEHLNKSWSKTQPCWSVPIVSTVRTWSRRCMVEKHYNYWYRLLYCYDPETKQQSSQWADKCEPPLKKKRPQKSTIIDLSSHSWIIAEWLVLAPSHRFVQGPEELENKSNDHQPRIRITDNNNHLVQQLLVGARRLTIIEIANGVRIYYGSTLSIITDELE